jgi:hypothetical protein
MARLSFIGDDFVAAGGPRDPQQRLINAARFRRLSRR